MHVGYLFVLTKQHIQINSFSFNTGFQSVQNAVLHKAQQVAVKSFPVFYTGCSQAYLGSVCGAWRWWNWVWLLQLAATWHSSCRYYRSWGKKRAFLCLDQPAQRDSMLKQSRKLIGYTYLVCLCLFGSLFFPLFHWGRRFSSEPNLYSWASWGWRISLECS